MSVNNLFPTLPERTPIHAGDAQPALVLPPRIRSLWKVKTGVTAQDELLARQCQISPVTAAILRTRGVTTAAELGSFLNPTISLLQDPLLLPDIERAADRLYQAITQGEAILVFGDYDVDGITSTALLVRCLRLLKANVSHRLPERSEGYGISAAIVQEAAQNGIEVIITADCGTTAHEAALTARQHGIDFIVTDHHLPAATLPDAYALVNPRRADSSYPFPDLSGCGVAYKVLQVLLGKYWPRHLPSFEEKFVDLVALAAIADCVGLTGENRYLCFEGLRRAANTGKQGLKALMQTANLKISGDSLKGSHVGFVLGPRLNAAGRMASPTLALDLLLSTDPAHCLSLASQLEELNRKRQQETRAWTNDALARVEATANLGEDCLVTAHDPHWNRGVVGLIAGKLAERFSRPALAMSLQDGVAHGSGRSSQGFDLHALITHCRPLLLSGGGHAAACGFTVAQEGLHEFLAEAHAFAKTQLKASELVGLVEADCEVQGHHVSMQLATDLEKLEPCGMGNEAARLMLRQARIEEVRHMGASREHTKWRLRAAGNILEAVWWQSAHRTAEFPVGAEVDLVFAPELNHYNGNTRVQLVVKDARIS